MDDRSFFLISKALADPQRFDIYRRITAAGDAELACKTLVERLHVSAATISHHCKELVTAGLVDNRKDGQCVQLKARPRVIDAWLSEVRKRIGA